MEALLQSSAVGLEHNIHVVMSVVWSCACVDSLRVLTGWRYDEISVLETALSLSCCQSGPKATNYGLWTCDTLALTVTPGHSFLLRAKNITQSIR